VSSYLRFSARASIATAVIAALLVPGGRAIAADDVAAPVVQSATLSSTTVDVSTGAQTVVLEAHITDDLSGVHPQVLFGLDSDTTTQQALDTFMTRVSGTPLDGVWRVTLTIPRHAATGTWTARNFGVFRDEAGNRINFPPVATGSWPTLTVANDMPDTMPPVVQSATLSSATADVTFASKTVVLEAHITDDITGVNNHVLFGLDSDATTQQVFNTFMTRVSGTPHDGVWRVTLPFPMTAAPGQWTARNFGILSDALGNQSTPRPQVTSGTWPTLLVINDTPDSAPNPPSVVSGVRGDKQATVSWSAVTGNHTAVTGYAATSIPGGMSCSTTGATSCTIPGLTNGTAYTFVVTATNNAGEGPPSEPSGTVTPAGVPFKPAPPVAVRGDKQANVSWTAAAGNGSPVTGYTVTSIPGAKTCSTTGATACSVTALANGTAYTFVVTASNTVGDSEPSEPADPVSAAGVPLKPAAPVAVRGNTEADVSWIPTGANGSPVTGYTVTSTPGGKTCSTTGATGCSVTGLTNATAYSFALVATNSEGDSVPSEPSSQVTPAGVPDKPAAPSVSRGDHQARVTWTATSGNGSPVTGFTVISSPGGMRCTTFTGCTFTGLTNGTAYTFVVIATNGMGDSEPSDASEPATPAGVPDRPAAPSAARGDNQAVVSWNPVSGNGSPVAGYTVTSTPGDKTCTTTGATTCTVIGLNNSTNHTFIVTATNDVGDSDPSEPSQPVTPAGVPDEPAAPTAVRGDTTARVTWTAPDANGSRVAGYTVTSTPGDKTCTTTGATTCTVTGLSNGTSYTFAVTATNTVGDSGPSESSGPATPAGVPARPTPPSTVRGDSQALVWWVPTGANGSPVTAYTVTSHPGGQSCTTTGATTCTVTGLTNGTAYTFIVTATNTVGDSQPSAPADPVSPAATPVTPEAPAPPAAATAPSRMEAPRVVVRQTRAILKWATADSNGSRVSAYVIQMSNGKDKTTWGTVHRVVFKDLEPGRYRFRIAATNAVGASPFSTWVKIRIR
jgi:chitodextrinase